MNEILHKQCIFFPFFITVSDCGDPLCHYDVVIVVAHLMAQFENIYPFYTRKYQE